MAQGSRGRWVRAAATACGMLICTGLVGCLNSDKSKDTKIGTGKQPTPGLPGTPRLDAPGVGGAGAMNTNTKGAQPNNQFTGVGSNLQPGGGFAAGNQVRPGTTGQNTLTSNPQQPFNYGAQPAGGSPPFGAPAQTGVQPAGGPLGMTNPAPGGHSVGSPPPPALPLGDIVPPAAPPLYGSPPGAPLSGGSPPASLDPIAPPAPPPGATGKGPPLSTTFGPGVGVFGSQ